MSNEPKHCCLCWVERGERTPAIENWPGFPICREHVAECTRDENGVRAMSAPPSAPRINQTLQ
jgi:hypothetical protein